MADNDDSQPNEADESIEVDDEQIVPEDETTESGKIESLKERLKECKQERKEYLNGWQRTKADLVNKKKEFEEEKDKIRSMANEKLVQDLIPVLDSFQMAFSDTEVWESVGEEWRTGIEHIHQQFIQALKDHGVGIIEPVPGDTFNPELHEAKDTQPTDDKESDESIARVQQRGYKLNERVIRPAGVIVNRYEEESDAS